MAYGPAPAAGGPPAWAPGSPADPVFAPTYRGLDGTPQPMKQWAGKVAVVNYWATWCVSCRTEIPRFMKLKDKYRGKDLVFVGVTIDRSDLVKAYAEEMKISYPLVLARMDAIDLTQQMGNGLGGLPYTIIIDRAGKIVATQLGEFPPGKIESILASLLEK